MIEYIKHLNLETILENNIFDTIGFNGPIIVGIITIYQLLKRKLYLIAFFIFYYFNTFINEELKMYIKQERPKDGKNYSNENNSGAHVYGMPSGHAQSVFFSLTFLHLVIQSEILLIINLFIASLTMYQRWSYKKHTIEQLIAGAIAGVFIAYISFRITKKYLEQRRPNWL
jgi:membrane-associated phospholipid phosphatase